MVSATCENSNIIGASFGLAETRTSQNSEKKPSEHPNTTGADKASSVTYVPGRPLIRGHFFQNSLASTIYSQIAQYSDMLRKIG